MTDSHGGGEELTITRHFEAPPSRVWNAWTEPAQVMRWWGPKGYTSPVCEIELRVGGKYLFCMRSPEGKDYYSTGTYRRIDPLQALVFTDSFADEKGSVVSASAYGMSEDLPLELVVTLRFEEQGGRTRLSLTHAGLPAGEVVELTRAGWNESLDKLAESLG